MTELEMWCDMGLYRRMAVARKLGVTKQNVQQLMRTKETTDRIYNVINLVEQDEMKSVLHCKTNILKAAQYTKSSSELMRSKAYFALSMWVDIYSDLINEPKTANNTND